MSVAANLSIELQAYGVAAEPGMAVGEFGGHVALTGDAGGGTSSISIQGDSVAVVQNRLFLLRGLAVSTIGATARQFRLEVTNHRFNQAVASGILFGGLTVLSNLRTVADCKEILPFLWRPSVVLASGVMLTFRLVNIEDEITQVWVYGEYWESARLRQKGIGPLVRW